jgi:hypothetical protein
LAFENFFQITAAPFLAVYQQNLGLGADRDPGNGLIVGGVAVELGLPGGKAGAIE